MSNQSTEKPKKLGRFKRSLALAKSSWQVLRLEKNFMLLPIVGMLIELGLIIAAAIVVGLVLLAATAAYSAINGNDVSFAYNSSANSGMPLWGIIPLGIFILISTFTASLVYGAIVYGALERFKGNDPTIKSCMKAAYMKKKPLFMFSLLSAFIGTILTFLEDRLPLAGKIATRLTGAAWAFASMFAVPFIMTSKESLGPIESTKESVNLIKRVWGESLIISAGIGLVGTIAVLSYGTLMFVSSVIAGMFQPTLFFVGLGLGTVILIVMLIILSVLSNIAQAAIFYWATTGKAPKSFDKEILQSTMTPKKARKVFA